MSQDEAQQLIQKLLLQALSRRLPQSMWLSLLHQLARRIQAAQHNKEGDNVHTPSPASSYVAGTLVQYILSQSSIDPLLIEYLQAIIYGSANRSGVTPDQGPLTDVITVTLHLLANVRGTAASSVPAIETISSVIGQGLLVTFQAPVPFRVSDSSFVHLLQHLFARTDSEHRSSNISSPANHLGTTSNDAAVAPAALVFIVSNLRLLALAAEPNISSPQNLLAPRVAITVLINVGQALLAHVIQRLSAAQASKDPQSRPTHEISDQTRSMSKTSVAEIEAVLQSMNPAWKDEIALLRSLTSQIGVIEHISQALTESSASSSASLQTRRKKAETLQVAQSRVTWDHFVDITAISPPSKPQVEPEIAFLMHLLVDKHVAWDTKLDAVKTLFLARRNAAAPSLTLEKSLTAFYFELLVSAIEACASVVEQPPAFKGAEVYAAIWRHALCGMIPELVLQLEQWLDAHQDLPLRGQRLEPPHVRLEAALRSSLLVLADRLNTCESATLQPQQNSGDFGGEESGGDVMTDLVGLDSPPVQPIKAWLLRACIEHSLARPEAIADEFPDGHKLASEVQSLTQSLRMDAQLEGLALDALFETRISTDDPLELLNRVASDPGTHFIFARQLVLQMQGWLEQQDLESIARWCKALSEEVCEGGSMLDTIMIYIDPVQLVDPLASVLDRQDVGQTSDEPSTLSNILLFAQLLCYRYSIPPSRISRYLVPNDDMDTDASSAPRPADHRPPFLALHLSTSSTCYPLSTLSEDERNLVSRWIHALFGNEGISDDLISASPPTTLLRLSPLLFSQSISACQYGVIDLETLRGGLSYFLQDLLSFALPGALIWLLGEITRAPMQPVLDFLSDSGLQASVVDVPSSDGILANGLRRSANSKTIHLEVLALLVDTDACPSSVRQVIAGAFSTFVHASEGVNVLESGCESFNLASLKARMEASGATAELLSRSGDSWLRNSAGEAEKGEAGQLYSLFTTVPRSGSFVTAVGKAGVASSSGEQKAFAAYLSLVASSTTVGVHPVLSFIQHLDLASLESTTIDAVIRILVLILGLTRAFGTIRATTSKPNAYDPADGIFALASSATRPGSLQVKQTAGGGSEGGGRGAMLEGEPNTPPLPSTTGPDGANGDQNTTTGPSVAALMTDPRFRVTSKQITDMLAYGLFKLKSSRSANGRMRSSNWIALENAILDNLNLDIELGAETGECDADTSKAAAGREERGLIDWLTFLLSS
ncbi:related to Mediator of RNA polymerase II transcription subunit 5 [Melanopsichium pennsylvanicum]|uniref:Mediator of RNA polymerase II transcription subunit 5 n=2 Tax=Melanopsichium pennsylvanicum TaxID=63383 RepID=A0AAJ4XJZ0_9BASI|nr:putative protein [Melanopsichium pennsylvanicum 4]SNX83749.1 related to Mediator of RNA polymerase II transcription subunit 5 [Melanopsichium pennsylvanicum]